MRNIKDYYRELGRLLYAIAMADGIIQPEEIYELHHFVIKELALNERTYDSSGMNQAFYVDFEFDDQIVKHLPLNGAVKNFRKYIEKHIEPGDGPLIDRSVRLMEAVAYAYSKRKEKQILDQVKQVTDHLTLLKERK